MPNLWLTTLIGLEKIIQNYLKAKYCVERREGSQTREQAENMLLPEVSHQTKTIGEIFTKILMA